MRVSCGFPAGMRGRRWRVSPPCGETRTATPPPHWSKPATPDRWPVIVALLAAPEAESRRLARLLERWPAVRCAYLLENTEGAARLYRCVVLDAGAQLRRGKAS